MVTLRPDGTELFALGAPDEPMFPRSSAKPLQAVGMLRAGLAVDQAQLALVTASHSGEREHVAGVRDILAAAGLAEAHLRCPPSLPLSEQAAADVLRAGGGPLPVYMNCSGKHAGMLRTCVEAGWAVGGYPEPDHPLQVAVAAAVAELTDGPIAATAVDGCGAPLFAVTLRGLARAFARLVTAGPATPERLVADAMRAHPDLVGGTGREATDLLAGVPGLLTKDGAEGVFAAALPDGSAVALKIDDGGNRARTPVLVRELRRLGATGEVLDRLAEVPVLGGGRQVGAVRVAY